MLEVCERADRSRPYSQVSSWKYTSWDVTLLLLLMNRRIKVCDLVTEMKPNTSGLNVVIYYYKPCCVTHRHQGCCCSLTVINVCVWILFSLPQSSFGILLNAALLFLLSHLLPQQLTDISQRVGFTWECPHCFAEPADLSFPVKTIKQSGRGFPHRSVVCSQSL